MQNLMFFIIAMSMIDIRHFHLSQNSQMKVEDIPKIFKLKYVLICNMKVCDANVLQITAIITCSN